MNDFKGNVVLITGAGKGRGHALAQALAERGAFVAVNDISPVNLDPLVAQGNGRIKAYVEDVAKKVGAQHIVNRVQDDFGRIDILVNHAAVEPRAALLEMDEWDWHRVLDVNVTGSFLMMQSAGRVMREQGGGRILNLVTESTGDEKNEAAFVASMKAFEALSRQAEMELGPLGIRVHTLNDAGNDFIEKALAILEVT